NYRISYILLRKRPHPRPTLYPYTTLFRSYAVNEISGDASGKQGQGPKQQTPGSRRTHHIVDHDKDGGQGNRYQRPLYIYRTEHTNGRAHVCTTVTSGNSIPDNA